MSYDPRDPHQPYQPPVVAGGPGYGQSSIYPPPSPAPERRATWPYALLAVAIVVLGVGVWSLYDRGIIFKDSGVQACEALRDGNKLFTGAQQTEEKLTEAQYRELRAVFEDSRHDDIRDHGTKLMDVVWQVSQISQGGEPGMEVLAYLGPLTTHMTGLQSACADQGVVVNLKPAAGQSAAAEAEPGLPQCADLFPAAGAVTADEGVAECEAPGGGTMGVSAMPCSDGRYLFQVTPAGKLDPVGWGFSGGQYHKIQGDPLDDEDYTGASTDCLS